MKKYVFSLIIGIALLSLLIFLYYKSNKQFNVIYSGPVGFVTDKKAPNENIPDKEVYIFSNNNDWYNFKNNYLKRYTLPNVNTETHKLILVAVPWEKPNSGKEYKVKNINIKEEKLYVSVTPLQSDVYLENTNNNEVYKYIILLVVNRDYVPLNIDGELITTID